MDVSQLPTIPIPIPAGQGSGQLYSKHGAILSINVANTHATVALSADLIDGSNTGGLLLVPVRLAVGAAVNIALGEGAVEFSNGLYLSLNTGTVIGSIVIAEMA